MSIKVNWTITDQNITVNYDGQTHIVSRADALSAKLIAALREKRSEEIPGLVSAAKRLEEYSKGTFTVKGGVVHVNGMAAPDELSNKILKFSREDLPYEPLVKFAANLQDNPSYRAVNELFQFLEKNNHPITEEGNFIAYKRVRSDFKDIYTGKMDNSVGQVLSVPRNQVDEDSSVTCSYGLHVANWNYAHTQYASSDRDTDVMLEVEVNPADVVAVPGDYNQSKMRVCKYKVLGVVTTPFKEGESLRRASVDSFCSDECDCDEDEEDDYDYCEECGRDLVGDKECCMPEEEDDEIPCNCEECDTSEKYDETCDPYPYDDELE